MSHNSIHEIVAVSRVVPPDTRGTDRSRLAFSKNPGNGNGRASGQPNSVAVKVASRDVRG